VEARAGERHEVSVVHDGELDDVCALLDGLGASWRERRGDADAEPDDASVRVGTPRRLLEGAPGRGAPALRIAVVDDGARTLLAMLRRAGVEYVVRRPVHPAALRLLLLRVLYAGPERRRRARVTVGAPVRFRGRLFSRRAVLAELSLRGCRLLSSHTARRDARIRVRLPARLAGGRALSLPGRVVRTGPGSGEECGAQCMAVVFEGLGREELARVQGILEAHARGPASCAGAPPLPRRQQESSAPPAGPDASASPDEPRQLAPGERRCGRRADYPHHVVALGAEAAGVLVGRDLSEGGMRVEPHDELTVGDALKIALHAGPRTEPLVLGVRVERDDGRDGLLLRFEGPGPREREQLAKIVQSLPGLESAGVGRGELVVSEIVERAS